MTVTKTKTNAPTTARIGAKPQPSGLGLDTMGDLSALLNTPTASANDGGPLLLDMDLIDEDPNQPRTESNPGFLAESLGELAESIKRRGVKTPISVRHNTDVPGRLIINHGARRFRGSRLAGQTQIPGFIDNDYNMADQVVENLLRNELSAREIADYIGRELAKGTKKGEIAEGLSKSPSFVSQHVTLLDLPELIAEAFNSGRVNDVTVVNKLVTAFKKNPKEVTDWLADESQEITRGSVDLLREFLDAKRKKGGQVEGDEESRKEPEARKKEAKPPDLDKIKKAIVQVRHNERPARLLLNRRPPAEGFAWLKYDDDGEEFEASLSTVQLVAVFEG